MKFIRKLVGISFFLIGLAGCLYYLAPTIFQFDPSTGASLMGFIGSHIHFLDKPYGMMMAQSLFGVGGQPVIMLIISAVVLFIGLAIAK